jgi:hypothetical protein
MPSFRFGGFEEGMADPSFDMACGGYDGFSSSSESEAAVVSR